jgi:hypothetical protein
MKKFVIHLLTHSGIGDSCLPLSFHLPTILGWPSY